VLGQVKVNEKSNEIIAIPALLDMVAIEGAVATMVTNANLGVSVMADQRTFPNGHSPPSAEIQTDP